MICGFIICIKLWKNHTPFTESSQRLAVDLRPNAQSVLLGERLVRVRGATSAETNESTRKSTRNKVSVYRT